MKHNVSGYKLKRDVGARKALLKGLVTSVIEQERIVTTVPKAKAVQPLVEKMITLAKQFGVKLYLLHQSTPEEFAAIQFGRQIGVDVYGEITTVHLAFSSADYAEYLPALSCRGILALFSNQKTTFIFAP